MNRWLERYREATSDTPRHAGSSAVDDFVTQGPVCHELSPSVSADGLRFSIITLSSDAERDAVTLARWIVKERPNEVHVRDMLRRVQLPGLQSAERVKAAAKILVDACWLRAPTVGFGAQRKVSYIVNPQLWVR